MGVGGVCVGLVGPARAGFCGVCLWLEVFGSGSVLVVVRARGGLGVSFWCSVVVVGLGVTVWVVLFGWWGVFCVVGVGIVSCVPGCRRSRISASGFSHVHWAWVYACLSSSVAMRMCFGSGDVWH